MPRCAPEQSTEKWCALFVCGFREHRRVFSIFGIVFTCFHISKRITAQIKEYSMVQGKRNGDAFCTSVPIMLVLWHSLTDRRDTLWGCTSIVPLDKASWPFKLASGVVVVVLMIRPASGFVWFSVDLCCSTWCPRWKISCFVSSTSTCSHSHRFVATMCIRPNRATTLCRARSNSVVFRKMNCIWMMHSSIRAIGVNAIK